MRWIVAGPDRETRVWKRVVVEAADATKAAQTAIEHGMAIAHVELEGARPDSNRRSILIMRCLGQALMGVAGIVYIIFGLMTIRSDTAGYPSQPLDAVPGLLYCIFGALLMLVGKGGIRELVDNSTAATPTAKRSPD
jgi:hypothetical protein